MNKLELMEINKLVNKILMEEVKENKILYDKGGDFVAWLHRIDFSLKYSIEYSCGK